MKNTLLILICSCLFLLQNVDGQTPENINYQAIARDADGNPRSGAPLTIRLSILRNTVNGPISWQETHSVTTNGFGQYRLQIGTGTSTGAGSAASFSAITWGSTNYFLKTEINAGSGFENMGTDPMSSVPYALFSKSTAALPNGTSSGQVLSWNGTNWVPASICSLLTQYYRDSDGDGFGNPSIVAASCFTPNGYVLTSTDCNDNNAGINPSITEICNSIDDNCDGLVDNGVNVSSDLNNCGACGIVCASRPNAITSCVGGICHYTCVTGFSDCNNNMSDGCEISILADLNNCGSCNAVCPPLPHMDRICSTGLCSYVCSTGFANCNNNQADGCEISLLTSTSNCGSCGLVCNLPNASATCSNGVCVVASCSAGFANCNGKDNDGCEMNLLTTTTNCGACGNVCALPNAVSACIAGACTLAFCLTGFSNCDGSISNGCEVNILNNASNCGSCGHLCATGHLCVNGVCN